jgi:hypothetical protein
VFDDEIVTHFTAMQELARAAAPYVDSIVASPEGRRRATEFVGTNYEHIPAEPGRCRSLPAARRPGRDRRAALERQRLGG